MMDRHYDYLFNNKYGLHYEFDQYGYAWFLASELAHYLGYSEPHHMTRMCDQNEVINLTINNPIVPEIGLDMSECLFDQPHCDGSNHRGGIRHFTAIHESGVYRIAMNARSDRKEVNDFKDWVLRELLPGVRMTGAYISPEMEDQLMQNPEQIRQIIEENRRLRHQAGLRPLYHIIDKTRYPYRDYEEMRASVEMNKQFINTGRAVYQGNENITIAQLAKIISQEYNYHLGEHSLKCILRENDFLIKGARGYNDPTQKAIAKGYIITQYNSEEDRYEHLVTPAGVNYFINMIVNKGY